MVTLAKKVLPKTLACSSMPMRLYAGETQSKAPPLVLYFGGGSFLARGFGEDECPAARALANAGAVVVEADYGSGANNRFPQVLDGALGALHYLKGLRKQLGGAKSLLLVAGEEAGGNVAAGVALKARDQMGGELAGQVLLSPMVDPMMANGSIQTAEALGMGRRWSDGWSHYLGSGCGFSHPYAAPCLCSRLSDVVPTLLVTAQDDPLRDEGLGYAERLAAAGTRVTQYVFPAGSGWTGIYRREGGAWTTELTTQFTRFVGTLGS